MMRLNRLAGFSAGPILSLLCSLATVPAVAWLFPPADIGRLDFFMTACTVAGLLLSLGLDKAFLHEYHYSTRRSSLLKACLLPAVLLAPVVLAVILLFAALVSQLLFDVAQPALAFLFAAGMLSAVANRLIAQLFRMQERAWVFSLAQVLPKMTLLLLLPVLWLDPQRNFVHLASVVVATTWLVTLWLLWHARVSLAQAWSAALDRLLLRRLLSEAGPLLVSAIGYLSMLSAGMGLLRFFAGLARLFGSSNGVALRTGLGLAQAGEFGFVLLNLAGGIKLMDPFVVQVDQATGVPGPDPLDVMHGYRAKPELDGAICFGMNAIVTEGGDERIVVGQDIGFELAF
jgi:O-antigen/teichoic acid export membrane protein